MLSNKKLAINLAALATGMLMLAYASVPLYRLFCEVTGYGGATRAAKENIQAPGATPRDITVTFNADIDPGLPWSFKPLQRSLRVAVGEQSLAYYEAENRSDKPITGRAVYNVTPFKAGPHFVKIACFCFEEQTLKPGQRVTMPVSFYIDPSLAKDPNLVNLKTITLSYTFFSVENGNGELKN